MFVESDEMRGLTFYQSALSTQSVDVSAFYPYISKDEDGHYIFLRYQYASSDWLFMESFYVSVGEEVFEIEADYLDVDREVLGAGYIVEWYDDLVNQRDIDMLIEIANSEGPVVLRYNGQSFYDEYTLTTNDKEAIRQMLAMIEFLGGRLDRAGK